MTITWGFPDGSVGKESTCHAETQETNVSVMFVAISLLNHARLFCDPKDCSPPAARLPCPSPDKDTGSGLPFPSPGDCPNPGIEPASHAL